MSNIIKNNKKRIEEFEIGYLYELDVKYIENIIERGGKRKR